MKTHLAEWSVSHERLLSVLDYQPDTGMFVWKLRIGRRGVSTVGQRAGNVDPNGYRYIRIDGKWYLAQKLAWFYVNGEWPDKKLVFANGDKDDCRIDNLCFRRPGAFDHRTPAGRAEYGRADRALRPARYRAYALKKDFGIDLAEYQALFVAQGGVCGACKRAETEQRNGRLKWLAVDHDHDTGGIRGLLCVACNTGIGKFGDDPAMLRAAADYLERYAAEQPVNVIPLKARGRRNTL